MPVWKFTGTESGTVELVDAKLELSTYYQSLEDLKSLLRAHDGVELEDLRTWLIAAGVSLDDLGSWLSTENQTLEDARFHVCTVAQVLSDLKMRLDVLGLDLSDLSTWCQAAGYRTDSLKAWLQAVSPTVLQDLMMLLAATDGTILSDCRMALSTVGMAPAFRSIVAQRLSANIHEV